MSEELIGSPRAFEGGRVEPAGDVVVMADEVSAFMSAPEAASEEGEATEGDEDESVDVTATESDVESSGDIVYDLAVAAATSGREFDGRVLAELLDQAGPVEDVRLSIAIEVLRMGQKVTGDRMLRVLESLGFEGEALAGRVAREEIAKLGGVAVESTTALPAGAES